nr:hypothetical protein [Agrobacterium cavarae]
MADIVYLVEDVIVPEADDGPAVLLEVFGSLLVVVNSPAGQRGVSCE